MKKRIIIISVIVLALLILFLPIPRGTYRDGGTKDYSALTYRIVLWNRLSEQINEDGYDTYQKTSVFWFPDNFKSIDELWEIERSRNGYFNISYEFGSAVDFTSTPSEARAGDTVELRTEVLFDADIHVYVDGQEIEKTHYDSDYWGYSFIMPDHDVLVTARFYTKAEIWGTTTVDERVLREKYPEYYDLSTFKGLEVYVWQMAPNSYSCGVMEGTNRDKTLEEMMNMKGASIDEMKAILSSYDIPKENIIIIPWQNPISSYLGEYLISQKDEDPASVAKRRQEYVDMLREKLLDSKEIGSFGSELSIRVNGQTMTYERFEAGTGSLTPKTVLATFSEATEFEGIIWDVYSAEEYPDLTYVLAISGTNASWTYRIVGSIPAVTKVAYANWTENNRIISSCLNAEKAEKRNINTVWHLPVFKFDTKEDLDLFREQFEDILTFEQGYDEVPSFNEVVSEYDDAFFVEHTVILAYVTAGSGSLRFGIRDVHREGNTLCLNVMQTNHPESGTDDMAGWFMIAEVLDEDLESITNYDAKMVTEAFELPDDFSFSIVWGCYGISSYDSNTGKLVKTKDATDVSKYTSTAQLTEDQMREVYRILFSDIDIFEYPDSYDPFNAPDAEIRVASEPNQTIIISVTASGRTKTVTCNEIAFGSTGYCEEARSFMDAENKIVELITSLPEWAAFPEYEFFYE